MSSISMRDFFYLSDISIIDIRSSSNYNKGHISGAINIPYEKLIVSPGDFLKKDVRYYLYCQKGVTSYGVCNILSHLGYDVLNIEGGYDSYKLYKNS